MTNEQNTADWKLIGHSHQIADTGDYDGHYEITNGKISLLTQDDDDEALHPIVDALNDSGCKFYQDDWFEIENKLLKDDNSELRERVKELQSQLTKYSNALKRIDDVFGILEDEWEDSAIKMYEIAKEALKQEGEK